MELITFAGIDDITIDALLLRAKAARPGMVCRVLRRGYFELGSLEIAPNPMITGRSSFAEHNSGGSVYLLVAQFT